MAFVVFRAAVLEATVKTAMVVRDPISWNCSLEFWDH
jgi:hypothetical protein